MNPSAPDAHARPGRPAREARLAVMIPRFPQQTHIAWWRVAQQMRWWGAEVTMCSTRRADAQVQCHTALIEESARTWYLWPPRWGGWLVTAATRPVALLRGAGYLLRLPESSWPERLRKLPLLIPAVELVRLSRRHGLDALFVHSCADAAHLAALCRRMGGPRYALRLGGDLEVYGKDHRAKMADAEFVAAGAAGYLPRIVNECGVPEAKAFWTWVGVDCRTFTPGPPRRRAAGDPLHVVTVGRLTDTKGHVDGLDAIARLRERGITVRHSIAGRGPEEPIIRERIAELGLQDRVHLLGPLDQDRVVELLRGADAFMLCSYGMGESTPAVVSEAMACGVPVVCTIIGGTTDMITDGVDGLLVPQRDPAALAEALGLLATDETKRQRLAAAALASSGRFDCRTTARRVLEAFGFTCDEPGDASMWSGPADARTRQPRRAAEPASTP